MKKLKLFFVLFTFLALGLATQVHAIPTTLVAQEAEWQYSVLSFDLFPTWDSITYASFDWSAATWSTGDAAFGNPYSLPYNTTWAANTDLALQKTFTIDGTLSAPITLNVASDNGFIIFINGVQVAKEIAEGYTSYWEYALPLTTLGFIAPGTNTIQVLAEDHGTATFFDMKLTGDVSVPEPATLLLFGLGLLGLVGVRRKFKK